MSEKSTKNLKVAIPTSEDESTQAIIELLKSELAEIKNVTGSSFKSNGKVEGFEETSIENEKSLEVLTKMASSVLGKEHFYNEAQAELQTLMGRTYQCPVYKNAGNTKDALMHDLALQIQILSVKERKEELEGLIKEAQEFLTENEKRSLFNKKVQQKLGKNSNLLTASSKD